MVHYEVVSPVLSEVRDVYPDSNVAQNIKTSHFALFVMNMLLAPFMFVALILVPSGPRSLRESLFRSLTREN